jgi:prepilin-type N-terminal cleavage/methylation domain-containing protein
MNNKKGFTLIELLVVIAIIGLLSSLILVSISKVRAKARDAKRKADFAQISKAIQLFFSSTQGMPLNNECGSPTIHFCAGVGDAGAHSNSGTGAYQASMQELVSAGLLSIVPMPPSGSNLEYTYYNYGAGPIGGLVITVLETSQPSLTGDSPSCRPWHGSNWCRDDVSDTSYCICNPQ